MNIQDVLRIMELPPTTFKLGPNQTFDEAQLLLEEFKKEIHKQRRRLAKKYHPDVSQGNIDKMQVINQIVELVDKMRIRRPQQMRVIKIYREPTGGYGWASNNNTTDGTGTSYFKYRSTATSTG